LSTSNWIELVVAVIALAVLALSTWVETSLINVSRIDIRRLFDNRLSRADALAIERTQRLRSSVLLIAVIASGVAVALFTAIFRDIDDAYGLVYGLLIALALVVVVGRVLPRMFANEDDNIDSPGVARVARVLTFIFAPVVRPVEAVASFLTRGRRRVDADDSLAIDEELMANGYAAPERERPEPMQIEEDEQDMISGVLHLEQASARQIMVPRIDIVAIGRETLVSEAVDIAIQAGHSRIPVYGRSIDEIVGVIYAKDFLKYVNEPVNGLTVEALMRPAYFVPESKRVDDLLNELQQSKVHLAVVVDEYGGTAGVVTIEDILEEIVGEIQDEFDRETPQLEIVGEREAIADGRISIRDLCDEMDIEWPGPSSGTLGGFIQRQLGRIPSESEVVEVDDLRLTVLKVEHHRVRQVQVERLELAPSEALASGVDRDADEAVVSQFP
jgi:CBS domain containing-hemolysin-like protein